MSQNGVSYSVVDTDIEGSVKPEDVKRLIRPETKAVIVTHASNVCGTIVPIRELGEICENHNLFFVV